ncbi:hypothetical protein N7528_002657 [Penicillium herquei]|nr:hypothetical protein N7528_002657 [Penicillium herquei]
MYYTTFTILVLLAFCTNNVFANVEKTIFLAPPPTTIPSESSDLDDLGLERLSPESPVVRTQLNASFPTPDSPDGTESWFFLENLNPGQRYEVRICWLATQPTSFTLTTHSLSTTIEDSSLLSSLSIFSTARITRQDPRYQANTIPRHASISSRDIPSDSAPTTDSVLFLRVSAAADYFSHHESLMKDVPPVTADLILDPFLWNVFPRSLVPTAGWIAVVSVIAIIVGKWVAGEIGKVLEEGKRARELEEKKGK